MPAAPQAYGGMIIVSCIAWLAMRRIKQRKEEVRRAQVMAAAAESIDVVTMNTQRLLQTTGLKQRVTKTRSATSSTGLDTASNPVHHKDVDAEYAMSA